ncbi:RsmB/NOP family class I SAM-dependent RNA methyltransferase [Roseospirillum parvum]|uniref:16S rRNA (Cytosine967-C5)-methyltransferase n=1 Tax=Roseospirillum parvum TaxID=83401 RepID=A0A1G7W364_9PROT|nr:transcription antitermination factor NusB [Roseospirillum parvum]SDG66328.1 16S rRNA (cytosine967-C5)-methyltransferase [Roseospirillum parvum]
MSRPPRDSRAAALALLTGVLDEHRTLDQLAPAALASLPPAERALAQRLAATTLKRLGQIDALLAPRLPRGLKSLPPAARGALRLGVAQRWFADIPAHAAINTSVNLLGRQTKLKGLVNAVLRRLEESAEATLAAQDAARLNTPDWLWRTLEARFDGATARAIASAHLAEPPLDVTLKPGLDAAEWAGRLGATVLPTGSLRLPRGGDLAARPGHGEGLWWVQDAAAALPARLLAPRPGEAIADLCAAPGGKTLQLAAAGARVMALDNQEKRLVRLHENLARTGLEAEVIQADAATWTAPRPLDAVLLDAPCSASGTVRRHPDLPHLRRGGDVGPLLDIQRRLLANAAGLLRPGGRLVYAVCALSRAEGPDLIADLPAIAPDLAPDPFSPQERASLPGLLVEGATVTTHPALWPELGGLDGFFMARLRRRG